MSEFHPLDQEFLPAQVVRNETIKVLAQLELQKHQLRMELIVHDNNLQHKLPSGNTIGHELDLIDRAILALKAKFSDVINVELANAGS